MAEANEPKKVRGELAPTMHWVLTNADGTVAAEGDAVPAVLGTKAGMGAEPEQTPPAPQAGDGADEKKE